MRKRQVTNRLQTARVRSGGSLSPKAHVWESRREQSLRQKGPCCGLDLKHTQRSLACCYPEGGGRVLERGASEKPSCPGMCASWGGESVHCRCNEPADWYHHVFAHLGTSPRAMGPIDHATALLKLGLKESFSLCELIISSMCCVVPEKDWGYSSLMHTWTVWRLGFKPQYHITKTHSQQNSVCCQISTKILSPCTSCTVSTRKRWVC